MIENPDIKVISDGIRVVPPDWIVRNPPKLLFRLKGGIDVRGAIWEDPKGNGEISVYKDGYKVEEITWAPRQCKGYLECKEIKTNASRTAIIRGQDSMWKDLNEKVLREMSRFKLTTPQEEDFKQTKKIQDLLIQKLADALKRTTTALGSTTGLLKEPIDRAKLEGLGVTGYPVTKEPPAEDRTIIKRIYKGRDKDHVTQISKNGTSYGKATSDKKDIHKTQASPLNYIEAPLAKDRPLLNYYPDHVPPSVYANTLNEEFPYYKSLERAPRLFNQLLDDLVAELKVSINGTTLNDTTRMELSRERVWLWKNGKVYPLNAQTAASTSTTKVV
jgi:hypothetical protein